MNSINNTKYYTASQETNKSHKEKINQKTSLNIRRKQIINLLKNQILNLIQILLKLIIHMEIMIPLKYNSYKDNKLYIVHHVIIVNI